MVNNQIATATQQRQLRHCWLSQLFCAIRQMQRAISAAGKDSIGAARIVIPSRRTTWVRGPMHKGIVGRAAGTVPGYNYSPALRNAKIIWTEQNLDKWLNNPQELIPGTKMFYEVKNAQDRADIIAFLKERAR